MGKTLKYVKDFEFSSAGKAVGLCKGGMAKKGYAEGGSVKKGYAESGMADMKQDKAMVKAAVHKHEKALHKGEPLTKLAKGGMMKPPVMEKKEVIRTESVKAPSAPKEMLEDKSSLGIKGNKNPGIARRRMPVAPAEPMIKPFKAGGKVQARAKK